MRSPVRLAEFQTMKLQRASHGNRSPRATRRGFEPGVRYSLPCLLATLVATASLAVGQTGIDAKKPVFGGACDVCPWGAMAEVVKLAMEPYGYDVQICYNCNGAAAPRIVSEARTPPP